MVSGDNYQLPRLTEAEGFVHAVKPCAREADPADDGHVRKPAVLAHERRRLTTTAAVAAITMAIAALLRLISATAAAAFAAVAAVVIAARGHLESQELAHDLGKDHGEGADQRRGRGEGCRQHVGGVRGERATRLLRHRLPPSRRRPREQQPPAVSEQQRWRNRSQRHTREEADSLCYAPEGGECRELSRERGGGGG